MLCNYFLWIYLGVIPGQINSLTSIGLITSNGPHGHNIMACEWTHHLSHSPGLIAVSLGPTKPTVENIRMSKEFGISLCATDQTILASVAGGYSGRQFDKISALKELGFQFYQGDSIDVLMVKGASLSAECKLFKEVTFGDHVNANWRGIRRNT